LQTVKALNGCLIDSLEDNFGC